MLAVLVLALLAAGCGGGKSAPAPSGGSVAATVVWPQSGALGASALNGAVQPANAPAGVVAIRVTVSGADFASMVQTFVATPGFPGNGTIDNVPVGSGRSLYVEGRDAGGTPLYAGNAVGITIQAGITTNVVVALT
ncbi:MAG TPA: hypothetical protein VGC20_06295, partial [bacterium]